MANQAKRKLTGLLTADHSHRQTSHWHDECGVFGYFDPDKSQHEAARLTYLGLFALQHRGQDNAGIAINDQGQIRCTRNKGLLVEAIGENELKQMNGHAAIGHVRFAGDGPISTENSQPMLIQSRSGQIALAMNGRLVNHRSLRRDLQQGGAIFQTSSQAETILALLARLRIDQPDIEEAVRKTAANLAGAYAIVLMTADQVIGIRDPLGIRPLCLGKIGNAWVLASESCALDAAGGMFVRDVQPGEMITISKPNTLIENCSQTSRTCLFEYVYFSRPDSILDGHSVDQSRLMAGSKLAMEQPCPATVVVGAPDSGLSAALGFSKTARLPYVHGILKNRYASRSLIQPTAFKRNLSVSMKFSALRHAIMDQDVALIDDSLIRGTTIRHLVRLLKLAGARSVHLRIASPPVLFPCFYGIETPSQHELPASQMDLDDLTGWVGADSIGYLSLAGLLEATGTAQACASCFDGSFPAGLPDDQADKIRNLPGRSDPAVDARQAGETAHA